jgi:hypothetical protein
MNITTTKLEIAVEQLTDALRAYYEHRYFSAIVLAGAAEQLLAGYVQKHGLTPTWAQMRSAATKIAAGLGPPSEVGDPRKTEKAIGDLMNRAYNNSKHASASDHAVELDPVQEARDVIDRAISNFDSLSTIPEYDLKEIPLAQQFLRESVAGVTVLDA